MTYTNGHGRHHVNGQSHLSPAKRLRQLLETKGEILVAPGVYDGFSARIAMEVGFDCLYMVSQRF